MSDSFADDDLFFGSIPVFFKKVSGQTFPFQPEQIVVLRDAQHSQEALERLKPLVGWGEEYEKMVIPAIPSYDYQLSKSNDVSALPAQLQQPLLKVPQEDPAEKIPGVKSGVRSALVKLGGRWYRLKGCGNNDQGFPVVPVSANPNLINIRGSSFSHTTAIELVMSQRIASILQSEGFLCANASLGWFEYALPETSHERVVRCCTVFETLGNKRLGDHLLTGLERLLPFCLANTDSTELVNRFNGMGRVDGAEVSPTWLAVLMDSVDYLCATDCTLPEQAPSGVPHGVEPRWHSLWQQNTAILQQYYSRSHESEEKKDGARSNSLLPYIFYRMGYDCGRVLSLLQQHDCSWGTYVDEMGTHCNAHANNLVLLNPQTAQTSRHFLAPLDFDMAFVRDTFLFIPPQGQTLNDVFDEWMILERKGLAMTLGGDDQISTGVTAGCDLPPAYAPFRWALRDTLMAGFSHAIAGQADACPFDESLLVPSYALLRLALILTANEAA
eukprot:TRINITY_DN2478_c0_g1_i1.p1 TRINITY_DN2478_c0_g1~~TRINITY_DN2478_c0_g1_i1.p1  ORF type:complete len:528 (-),score=190.56 TRINITY_DN2478_c0_g1_i1:96-1592(-)